MSTNISVMTNNEKAKVMHSTQCEGLHNLRWGAARRCLTSWVASLFEQDMVKFSDFDYKNNRNHTKKKFKAKISRYILIFILSLFVFYFSWWLLLFMRYVYDPFSTAGRFTATEQTYHSPISVWFQNEIILGGGCHYCGSTRSQVQMGLVLTS